MKYIILALLLSTPAYAYYDSGENDGTYNNPYSSRDSDPNAGSYYPTPSYEPPAPQATYNDRNDRNDSVGQQIYDCAQTSSCQGQFSRSYSGGGL